jgi:competence protein ComEC
MAETQEILLPGALFGENGNSKPVFGGAVNYRPLFFAAVSLASGIALSAAVYENAAAVFVLGAVLILFALAGIVFAILGRRLWLPVAGFLLIGFALFFVSFSATAVQTFEGYAVVTGKISLQEQNTYREDFKYCYLLKKAAVDAKETKANAYLYTNRVYQSGAVVCAAGQTVAFNPDPFDARSMAYYNDGVHYLIYSDDIDLLRIEQPSATDRFTEETKELFDERLGGDASAIATALVLGDKSLLPPELSQAFRIAGLSHIFALSGLHIGFLVGVIFFICKKLKIGIYFAFASSFAAMLLYGAVAGFPASIVRAIVMTASGFLGFALFRRVDPLNTLSAAAIFILLFRPLSIFEAGFQMSFAAVMGIICFYKPLRRFFVRGKSKIAAFAGSSLALSLSANSFLFAPATEIFTGFGIYFCLSNLFVLPLIGLLYALTMAMTMLYFIFPVSGILILSLKYPYLAIKEISVFFSELPGAYQNVRGMGFLGVVYCFSLFFMSRFVMLSDKKKYRMLAGIIGFSLVFGFVFFAA